MSKEDHAVVLSLLASQSDWTITTRERLHCLVYLATSDSDQTTYSFTVDSGFREGFPNVESPDVDSVVKELAKSGYIDHKERKTKSPLLFNRHKEYLIQREGYRLTEDGWAYLEELYPDSSEVVVQSKDVGDEYGELPVSNLIDSTARGQLPRASSQS